MLQIISKLFFGGNGVSISDITMLLFSVSIIILAGAVVGVELDMKRYIFIVAIVLYVVFGLSLIWLMIGDTTQVYVILNKKL